MSFYPFALPITIALSAYNALLTGIFVVLKRRDDCGFRYFLFSCSLCLWGVALSLMLNNDLADEMAMNFGRMSQIVAVFIPVLWLHFVLAYTERLEHYLLFLRASYIVSFGLFPFTFTEQFIVGFNNMVGVERYPMPGLIYHLFASLFVVIVLFAFIIFFKVILETKDKENRWNYQLVFITNLFGFIVGGLSFLPMYGVSFPQYNLLLMPLWQIGVAFAMARYRVFDIEKVAAAVQKDRLALAGTLTASMNHEIKNPLYVIQSVAESCLEDMSSNEGREEALKRYRNAFEKCLDQSKRAFSIMSRFSQFLKPNKKSEEIERVCVKEIVEDVLLLVQNEIVFLEAKVALGISEELEIEINKGEFEEILLNIIMNCFQALKEQTSPTLKIEAARSDKGVEVSICDNGPGMPSDFLKKIFEPFYTTKKDGMGLGLYVTKKLVEKSRGVISVSSQVNEGTGFYLVFPECQKEIG